MDFVHFGNENRGLLARILFKLSLGIFGPVPVHGPVQFEWLEGYCDDYFITIHIEDNARPTYIMCVCMRRCICTRLV